MNNKWDESVQNLAEEIARVFDAQQAEIDRLQKLTEELQAKVDFAEASARALAARLICEVGDCPYTPVAGTTRCSEHKTQEKTK